jgi:hypothetical protein
MKIQKESGSNADLPILAGRLVAVAGGFGETVKVALLSLPSAIERSQSFLEAFCAKPVRVAISERVPGSPCFMASYALVHHKPFLLLIVSQNDLSSYDILINSPVRCPPRSAEGDRRRWSVIRFGRSRDAFCLGEQCSCQRYPFAFCTARAPFPQTFVKNMDDFFPHGYISFTSACLANHLHLTIRSDLEWLNLNLLLKFEKKGGS